MNLFRFQPINELTIKNLIAGKNWVADPYSFNDPFEFSLNDPFYYNKEGIPRMRDKIELSILEKIKKEIQELGVVCYSKDFKNHLLWSHYAQNHEGMCLVFDLNPSNTPEPLHVKYQKEFPQLELADENDLATTVQHVVTTKSREWQYENELRQVFPYKNQLANYPGQLIEIIFGCRTTIENMETILSSVTKNYNQIKISKMRIIRNEYRLGKLESETNKKIPHIWKLDIKYSTGLFNYS